MSGPSTVLVDTNVLSAELSRRRRRSPLVEMYREHLSGRLLVIAGQTVAEMRFGAAVAEWGEARRRQMRAHIGTAEIARPDDETADAFAELKAACWRAGHPLSQPIHGGDLWIAATAVRLGLPLVSHDGVFHGRPEYELITELPVAST
jgi:predicted nucleic acid-binding protein